MDKLKERIYSFKELKEMNLVCSDEFYKSIIEKEDNSFGFEHYKNHLMEGRQEHLAIMKLL